MKLPAMLRQLQKLGMTLIGAIILLPLHSQTAQCGDFFYTGPIGSDFFSPTPPASPYSIRLEQYLSQHKKPRLYSFEYDRNCEALEELADAYTSLGKTGEAERIWKRIFALKSKRVERDRKTRSIAEEAGEKEYRRLVDDIADGCSLARTEEKIADFYAKTNDSAAAETFYLKWLNTYTWLYPRFGQHVHTGPEYVYTRIGKFYERAGRLERAESMFREGLEARRKLSYSLALQPIPELALFYERHGRLLEAEPFFEAHLKRQKSTIPDGTVTKYCVFSLNGIADTMDHLAELKRKLGQFSEALKYSISALSIRHVNQPNAYGGSVLAKSLYQLALTQEAIGNLDAAKLTYTDILKLKLKYCITSDMNSTEFHNFAAMKIVRHINSLAESYKTLALKQIRRKQFDKAAASAMSAITLLQMTPSTDQTNIDDLWRGSRLSWGLCGSPSYDPKDQDLYVAHRTARLFATNTELPDMFVIYNQIQRCSASCSKSGSYLSGKTRML